MSAFNFYFTSDRSIDYFIFGVTGNLDYSAAEFRQYLLHSRFYYIPIPDTIPEWQFLQDFRTRFDNYIICDDDKNMNKLPRKFYPEALDWVLDKAGTRTLPPPMLGTNHCDTATPGPSALQAAGTLPGPLTGSQEVVNPGKLSISSLLPQKAQENSK